jgi:ABC-2 type transport system permease protein
VRDQYKLAANKNLIVFDLGGRTQIVPGDTLVSYTYTNVPNEKEIEMLKKPFEFDGEMWFTTALLALENPQPLKAYFLQGHGEPSLTDTDSRRGYLTFGNVLMHDNYLSVAYLQQLGNQGVPEDCNLLIIAAPTEPLDGTELQKINQYLAQGGRLFVLLDYNSIPGIRKSADAPPARPTGLEPILHDWGIEVVADYVKDPDYTSSTLTFQDIKVQEFSKHPVMDALIAEQLPLHMIFPRPIFRRDWQNNPPPNAPEVTELAFSSAASTLYPETGVPARKYPLMAAAEQKPAAGVLNPRGSTRIVVAGDSYFLGNHYIEDVGNRDFVNSAINWLLDRTALLKGIEPQKVTSYHLLITQTQQQQLRWILLGALPGAILMLGGLVWLVRRK